MVSLILPKKRTKLIYPEYWRCSGLCSEFRLFLGRHDLHSRFKTCSCPIVRYFRMLFWDNITIFWDKNSLWFFSFFKLFLWKKNFSKFHSYKGCMISLKKFHGNLFFFFDSAERKKVNKLSWYHPKLTYKIIVQMDMTNF
jgi:hypothetical protein